MKVLLLDLLRSIGLGIISGSIMAVVSNGFVLGVVYFTNMRMGMDRFSGELFGLSANPIVILWLLAAAVLVLATRRLAGIDNWQTPADSIYAAHMPDTRLDHKKGFASTLAAFISASGGASVGQYGPLVHFGGVMGSLFHRLSGRVFSPDVFIGCGVAGAISAGFGAPIAGIIFAQEAIVRHFSLRAIAPIAVAGISASAVGSALFGTRQLFVIEYDAPELFGVLPFLISSGVVFGLIAVFFMLSVRGIGRLGKMTGFSITTLTLMAAIICGLVGTFIPEILGLGTNVINDIFARDIALQFLVMLLVAKIGVTAICLGLGLFGGVFSPAMLVGASSGMIGAKLAAMLGFVGLAPVLTVGGLAAVSASVIGAPISAVMIVFELSGSYEFAVAAMICVVMSTLVSYLLFGHSYFSRQLKDRNIDITMGRGYLRMSELPVQDYMRRDEYLALKPDCTRADAVAKMAAAAVSEAYVLDNSAIFLGKVALFSLVEQGDDGAQASGKQDTVMAYLEEEPLIIEAAASVADAVQVASSFVGESLPILEAGTQRMIGVVNESDLFQAYLDLQREARQVEN